MGRHSSVVMPVARLHERAFHGRNVSAVPVGRHPGPQAKGRAAITGRIGHMRVAWAAAAVLSATMTLTATPPVAEAAAGIPCRVRNVTQDTRDTSFRRMVAAAQWGDRLLVRGTCSGGVTIRKSLVIEGVGPDATLSGRGRFRVLDIRLEIGGPVREPHVRIRGIRIIRGRTTVEGGGIRVAFARVTLTDSVVAGNNARSGGGIAVEQGEVTLRRTLLRNNAATSYGGGLYNDGWERVTLVESIVRHNRAFAGGGIADLGGTLTVIDSSVRHNTAEGSGGGILTWGSLSMRGSGVTSNTAGTDGGGIWDYQESFEQEELVGSTVTGNTAGGHGGGLNIWADEDEFDEERIATLADTTISDNQAGVDGGGIHAVNDVKLAITGATAITGNDPNDCVGTSAC